MDIHTLAIFAVTFFVFAASPGPDNLTIVARTVTHGAASGIAYGLGTVTGILFFLALAVFGLSLLASEMGHLMTVLRYVGAAWLIWTGIRLWTASPNIAPKPQAARPAGLLSAYLTGVLLNIGNPKMPLFYIALLPNVAGTDLDAWTTLQLALVILAVEVVVVGGHVLLAMRGRGFLRTPKMARRANRAAGSIMVGSGALALAVR